MGETKRAPMRRGPLGKRDRPLMRQGPLELLRLSTETLERAGRRPAPAFLDSSEANELPKLWTTPFVARD